MNDHDLLEQELNSLGDDLRRPPSIANAVLQAIAPDGDESPTVIRSEPAARQKTPTGQCGPEQRPSVLSSNRRADSATINSRMTARRTRRLTCMGLATAAGALLLLGGLVIINSRSALAWNDAVRQMAAARSLHCVVESLTPDGGWARSWEMRYDHQRGFVELHYDKQGLAGTEVDDGTSHWMHRRGQKVATRQSGLSVANQLGKLLSPVAANGSFQPEPAQDELFDGTRCRCLTAIDKPHQSRTSLWVDEKRRLRRAAVDRLIDDQWTTWCRVDVTYDIEVDATTFQPDFDENIKVVDLANLFEEVCPLENAVYREEQFGSIFAIHELKRLGDFEYYMLVSFRPTEKTRKALALQQFESAGQLVPAVRATIKHPVEQESGNLLGKARANGIEVAGYLVELRGFELQEMQRARPQFQFVAHAKLWNEVGAYHDILFDVPLPDEMTPKEIAVRSLYDTIAALEAVPMDELFLHDPLDGREFIDDQARGGNILRTVRKHMPKPNETSFETFYQHIEKRYLDSRPKTTVIIEGQ